MGRSRSHDPQSQDNALWTKKSPGGSGARRRGYIGASEVDRKTQANLAESWHHSTFKGQSQNSPVAPGWFSG